MMTEPAIRERPATPYAPIRRQVRLPFDDEIDGILDTLFSQIKAHKLSAAGPFFFLHTIIDMPDIDMEFGVPLAKPAGPLEGLITGTLPAGRFGELTHFGPYEGLLQANGRLIDWAADNGIKWDCRSEPDGDHFACRMEVYLRA